MQAAKLLCGIDAALRHRVYYRNDVRMKERKRCADAGRRCLDIPTLHFTKLQHIIRVRWAGIWNSHSFLPVQTSVPTPTIYPVHIYKQKKRRGRIQRQKEMP